MMASCSANSMAGSFEWNCPGTKFLPIDGSQSGQRVDRCMTRQADEPQHDVTSRLPFHASSNLIERTNASLWCASLVVAGGRSAFGNNPGRPKTHGNTHY